MTNAFSVLSLKRNRSTCKTTIEPVSKLSKLKSGLSIFSKITQSLTPDHHSFEKNSKRIGLFQYFRSSNADHDKKLDNDKNYEYNQYYSIKKNMERNIHTLPTATTKKITGILIKRSGTNPSTHNRTYSNATSMTINSEDLTAKEFADIAGIRILPEEEEEIEEEEESEDVVDDRQRKFSSQDIIDEDMMMNTISSRYTMKSNERLSLLSYTSCQSYSNNNKLKIWDNEFWSDPHSSSTTIESELDRKLSTKSTKLIEPPILHELRRMNTVNSIIKKGRFEIHLGTDGEAINCLEQPSNTDSTLSFSDDLGVLEWKRRKGKKSN